MKVQFTGLSLVYMEVQRICLAAYSQAVLLHPSYHTTIRANMQSRSLIFVCVNIFCHTVKITRSYDDCFKLDEMRDCIKVQNMNCVNWESGKSYSSKVYE